MSLLRPLGVALALLAAASMAVGAAGFSDVSAERGVEVSVVDDESAYVGVTACTNGNSEGNVVHLRVTNRFVATFDVDTITFVDEDGNQGRSDALEGNTEVAPGENEKFTQKFDGEVDTVEIAVTGDGFDATVTSEVAQKLGPDCPGQGEPNGRTDDDAGRPENDHPTDGRNDVATGDEPRDESDG